MSEALQERQRRAAVNQSLFRQMNESTERQHHGSAFIEFTCECAQKTCDTPVSLAVDEYEEVRKVSTHFIVAPGHLAPEAERVVRETTRYQVVEKIGVAAKVAVRLDPRSPV
jgi:hypothetical protein